MEMRIEKKDSKPKIGASHTTVCVFMSGPWGLGKGPKFWYCQSDWTVTSLLQSQISKISLDSLRSKKLTISRFVE